MIATMKRNYKKGDRITYRRFHCTFDIRHYDNPNRYPIDKGFDDVKATVISPAKGTDFKYSDLVVMVDDEHEPIGIVFADIVA